MNPFEIRETYDLIRVAEQITPAASYMLDLFFPNRELLAAEYLPIETMKSKRRLAPYVSRGARGLNVKREGSTVRAYKPPYLGARRIISLDDIHLRQFGETPVYSTKTPEQRAAEMQARDLKDLLGMLQNRRNQMAAEMMSTGKITIKEFADDGKVEAVGEINYGGLKVIETDWQTPSADIIGDLEKAGEEIQEAVGIIPTVLICGANVEKYMRKNKAMREWLMSGNANAVTFVNYQPQYSTPQVRNLGYLGALNLEMYSYLETYLNDAGEIESFVPADTVIIGVPSRGRQIYGPVSYLEGEEWRTALAENVPIYAADRNAQQTSLTVLSRFLPVPADICDWQVLKVSGETEGLPGI